MSVIYYLINWQKNKSPVGNFGGADCKKLKRANQIYHQALASVALIPRQRQVPHGRVVYGLNNIQESTPNITGRRFRRTMEWSQPVPRNLKALLFLPLENKVQNKGTQGVQARYDTELPPIKSIVRRPGHPVILSMERTQG